MVDGFIDVEEQDWGLFLLHDPVFGEVDNPSAVDEHEHLDLLISSNFFYSAAELWVGNHRVDFVLYVFVFEDFLG